jgi:hypothetical protein
MDLVVFIHIDPLGIRRTSLLLVVHAKWTD